MALSEPPPFQEAPRCDVCKCSFSTFRRRHHCRRCGRTLCQEHSSNQMALPQFGFDSPVRVCADCYNESSRYARGDPQVSVAKVDSIADGVTRLDIGADLAFKTETNAQQQPVSAVSECKCGMPLCICETTAPKTVAPPLRTTTSSTTTPQLNPKPKKQETSAKNKGSTSNSSNSSLFNSGQMTNNSVERPQVDYEVSGEGLREAIKNDDVSGVKKLLNQGVNANYRDKQGLSLLHLAALFNRTDITFTLMEYGASLDYKNAQGETALDCAPATLQYKMREKVKENVQLE